MSSEQDEKMTVEEKLNDGDQTSVNYNGDNETDAETGGSEEAAASQEGAFDLSAAGAEMICKFFVSLLGQLSWKSLGLISDPKTGEITVDLEEARLAIDVMGDVIERLAPRLADDEVREIRNLLTNLLLNFVDKSRSSQSETASEPDGTGEGT